MNLPFLLTLLEFLFFRAQSIDSKHSETSFGSSINSNLQKIPSFSTQQVRSENRPNELNMPKQKLINGQGTRSFDRLLPPRGNNQTRRNMMNVDQIQIGIENNVYIDSAQSTDDIYYMHVTNVCTRNPDTLHCEQDDSESSNPMQNYLEAPIIKKMRNIENNRYEATYTITHTNTGYVTVSTYRMKNGVRGVCYENENFSGPSVEILIKDQMNFNFGDTGLCGENVKVGSLVFKGKILFPRDGNYHLEVHSSGSNKFNLIGRHVETVFGFYTATYIENLSADEYDFTFHTRPRSLPLQVMFFWVRAGSNPMVLIPKKNLLYVESSWVSNPIHVTCFPGYYLDATTKSCLGCPEGTYKNQHGLTGCISCAPGTFNNKKKASMCEECPGMTYGDGFGLIKCMHCPPNSFAYNKGSITCDACDPLCSECFGPYNTQCDSCVESTGASFIFPNTCQCSDGAYYEPYFDKCISCHPLCSNCIGSSSTKCKGCNTSIAYEIKDLSSLISLCVTECPEGYYRDFFTCKCTFLFLILHSVSQFMQRLYRN